MSGARDVNEMERYLDEKKEMGMVHSVRIDECPGSTSEQAVRLLFTTFVRFYAQVIVASKEYRRLQCRIYDDWTAIPIVEGPHAGSNFPVDVGPYGVYSPQCARGHGLLSVTGELAVAWSIRLDVKEFTKLIALWLEETTMVS